MEKSPANLGEGNPEAAAEFNEAEQKFVKSERGKQKISRGAQEPDQGRQLFEKRCTGCHSLERNKEGPKLAGVYGRQAGTAPNFNYSAALKSAHFVWDGQKLEKWLTDTDALVEDNNMDFHVPKPEERAAIIGYLKSLSAPQSSASKAAAQ